MTLSITKNDKTARLLIFIFSAVVFLIVASTERFKVHVALGFDVHFFAQANAVINSIVALLLIAGLISAKNRLYNIHKNIMLISILLSAVFLVSYICHHLFAGEAKFGDLNHDGILSAQEKVVAGYTRFIYYLLLSTHIIVAGIVLPFILFTAYRALIQEYSAHRRIAKLTWPLWFYVAFTGPVVYLMISPYY
ncbi:MAG: DUF420 domain-containing protein [Flavisolibacter sp.]